MLLNTLIAPTYKHALVVLYAIQLFVHWYSCGERKRKRVWKLLRHSFVNGKTAKGVDAKKLPECGERKTHLFSLYNFCMYIILVKCITSVKQYILLLQIRGSETINVCHVHYLYSIQIFTNFNKLNGR